MDSLEVESPVDTITGRRSGLPVRKRKFPGSVLLKLLIVLKFGDSDESSKEDGLATEPHGVDIRSYQ